jgi:hypothetical protein
MSLTQLYALSAPALLGVLAIGFGLFELYRVRRMKAAFAATAPGGLQASNSAAVPARAGETVAGSPELLARSTDPATPPALSSAEAAEDIAPPLPDWPRAPHGFDVYLARNGMFVFMRAEENLAPRYTDWTGARYERDEATGQMVQVAAADQDRSMAAQPELDKAIDEISRATTTTQEKAS